MLSLWNSLHNSFYSAGVWKIGSQKWATVHGEGVYLRKCRWKSSLHGTPGTAELLAGTTKSKCSPQSDFQHWLWTSLGQLWGICLSDWYHMCRWIDYISRVVRRELGLFTWLKRNDLNGCIEFFIYEERVFPVVTEDVHILTAIVYWQLPWGKFAGKHRKDVENLWLNHETAVGHDDMPLTYQK